MERANEKFSGNKTFNKRIIAVVAVFAVYYIWYCNSIMIELPHMTWFDQIPLADKYFSGDIRISDLFSRYGEHGMLANNLLYLFNVIFFHGVTLFDVFINDLNVVICGVIIVYCTLRSLEFRKNSILWITAESIFMFSCMQASSGAMETQVRLGILFFLLAMVSVDRELQDEDIHKMRLLGTIVLIILSINVFGTLYSFAGVPLIWVITFFYALQKKKSKKKNLIISGTYLATIPMYIIEYRWFDLFNGDISGERISLSPIVIIKSIFAWYANGVLGWAYHESADYSSKLFLIIGFCVFAATVISVVLFFESKMYEKTWLPLMMIVYSIGVFAMVYLGRATEWEWLSNEWYNVHIKVSIAATIWIYGYCCNPKILAGGALVFLSILGIVGNAYGIKRAPSVHSYYMEKQKYLFVDDAGDMPVDEEGQTPLLHSLDATMTSISILKKYNLSVYQYWDSFIECPTTGVIGNEIKYLSGRFDDGWVEQDVTFVLNTNQATQLQIDYFSQAEQNIDILVDDVSSGDTVHLMPGANDFMISCTPNSTMTITLHSDYSSQLEAPDERVASYVISEIKRVE